MREPGLVFVFSMSYPGDNCRPDSAAQHSASVDIKASHIQLCTAETHTSTQQEFSLELHYTHKGPPGRPGSSGMIAFSSSSFFVSPNSFGFFFVKCSSDLDTMSSSTHSALRTSLALSFERDPIYLVFCRSSVVVAGCQCRALQDTIWDGSCRARHQVPIKYNAVQSRASKSWEYWERSSRTDSYAN